MTEEWRPIPGHDGYEASSLGRIRSYWTKAHLPNAREPHLLKATNSGHTHCRVYLAGVGVRYVHRLIALTFIGQPPHDGAVVRHLDDDPLNNRVDNLAYGTQVENLLDATRNGRNQLANLTHCKRGHEFTADNTRLIRGRHRECRRCYQELRGGTLDAHLIRAWARTKGIEIRKTGPIPKVIRAAYYAETRAAA